MGMLEIAPGFVEKRAELIAGIPGGSQAASRRRAA